MKKSIVLAAMPLLALAPFAAPVAAQNDGVTPEVKAHADALAQCMLAHTAPADKKAVIRWLVLSLATAPQVKGDLTVAAGAKDDADRQLATLFTRLVTEDCPDKARPLFKSGSPAAFRLAFAPLGQVAARDAFSDPDTAKAMMSYAQHIDFSKFAKVMN